jgi:hypothetical protein
VSPSSLPPQPRSIPSAPGCPCSLRAASQIRSVPVSFIRLAFGSCRNCSSSPQGN